MSGSLDVVDGGRGRQMERQGRAESGFAGSASRPADGVEQEELKTPELRWWMAGPELTKLARAAREWFAKLGEWAIWPAMQLDPMACPLPVLDLLAWERNIRRYAGEPERLYRLRVKYAYANGRDSGSTAGWKRIFARLELPSPELEERVEGQDWDIINIVLDDADLPYSQSVLEIIIDEYGRTCRRYRFVSRVIKTVPLRAGVFGASYCTVISEDNERLMAATGLRAAAFTAEYSTVISAEQGASA